MGEAPASAPSAGLAGLLEAQEVDAEGRVGRRRVAARRGAALLDRLESLRIDILTGQLPPQRLLALASAVREQRTWTDEAALDGVLAEIELRAEVELAKLTRASARPFADAARYPDAIEFRR